MRDLPDHRVHDRHATTRGDREQRGDAGQITVEVRQPQRPDTRALEHRGQAVRVVRVRVRQDHQIEAVAPRALQPRCSTLVRAAIDEHARTRHLD